MSRDPLGLWGDPAQRGNGQSYCANNPVNLVDPTGESVFSKAAFKAAKKALKEAIEEFIENRIKKRLKDKITKEQLENFVDRAEEILGALDDEWWEVALGLIPFLGDAYDCAKFWSHLDQIKGRFRTLQRQIDKFAERLEEAEERARRTAGGLLRRNDDELRRAGQHPDDLWNEAERRGSRGDFHRHSREEHGDPAASRPYVRKRTREGVDERTEFDEHGRRIDENTEQPIEGTPDLGHRPGEEWRRTRNRAREEGWDREDTIEDAQHPTKYRWEDPSSNRSHKHELPGED